MAVLDTLFGRSSRQTVLTAFAAGIVTSIGLALLTYSSESLGAYVAFLMFPGILAAMSACGVHGGGCSDSVATALVIAIDALTYGLAFLPLVTRVRSRKAKPM